MDSEIALKGKKEGLLLVINDDTPFEAIIDTLSRKLEAARDFFTKSPIPIQIKYKGRKLDFSQQESIRRLVEQYGLVYGGHFASTPPVELLREGGMPYVAPPDAGITPTLVLRRTLRGGQEIRFNGTVLILGDVNPTARIFAEGDIVVVGISRGILHAGALGDRDAQASAGRFCGGQIRLADCVVRAPDTESASSGPERARIKEGQIIVEAIYR